MAARDETWKEEELLAILDACRVMNSQRDLTPLFDLVAREATRLLEADRATIFLLDRARCELWSQVALGTPKVLRFDARLGLAGHVALNGEIVRIADAYEDDRFNPAIDAELGYRTRSVLAVPLTNEKREIVGVLQALNKKQGTFTDQDVRVLQVLADQAAVAVQTAELVSRLQQEKEELLSKNQELLRQARDRSSTRSILGTSPAVQKLIRQIEEIADSDVDVLISGESGTGKELVARAIHHSGRRSAGPFLALNCASLPESLVEAELFGINKGVATGVSQRVGKFEKADGGTLFLDEIGDLSLAAQAKILRVLQERVVERVGGPAPVSVDVRVLAATNKDLREQIDDGEFREDLYYRLKVIELKTPALREIAEDIPLLAAHFLDRYCREMGRPGKSLSDDAVAALTVYSWPGNVRELENEMKRLAATVRRNQIQARDLSESIVSPAARRQTRIKDAVVELEQRMIRDALEACQENRAKAARMLGLSRQGLLKKLQRYGMA